MVFPSHSGTLDRMENSINLDGRWRLQPETTGIIGYRYSQTDFTADQVIGATVNTNTLALVPVNSNSRNSRSHFIYAGLEHSFRPDLHGSVQAGGQYTDFYNANSTVVSPYAQLSLSWLYLPDSYLQIGFTHKRSATEVVGDPTDFVRDMETSVVFTDLHHEILPNLFMDLSATIQDSTFFGGGPVYDGKSETDYALGLQFEYHFNPNFSAQIGYNYDRQDSIAGRNFDRNRVYIGATASY